MFSSWYYLLSAGLGAVLTFAFAPFEYYPLTWLSLAGFFYLLTQASSLKHYLWLSYCFGLGLFGTGASWVFHSIYYYAFAPLALALFMTSMYVMFLALLPLLFGYLIYLLRLSKQIRYYQFIQLMILFPAAWVMIEWLRSWVLTGFPWLLVGHSQIDTLLAHWAPIAGELFVSWVTALIAAAIVLLFTGVIREKIVAIGITVILIVSSYALGSITWTTPAGKPLKIAMLQGNVLQEEKWLPEKLLPTIRLYKKLSDENWDADLIIWPETALPSYFINHMEDLILPLQKRGLETKTDLLIGGFHHVPGKKPDTENAILAVTQNAREVYAKQHLVPFSEYMPMLEYLDWLRNWVQLPFDSVRRGTGSTVINVAGQPARLSICYEDAYGTEMIKGLPAATLLINISNDGWFTNSIEPFQHMEIARMRAKETGRYLIRSTNIGISAIVNPMGRIIATADAYTTTSIRGEAVPYKGQTPFIRFGNFIIIPFLTLLLALVLLITIKRKI